jgi:hypothetical protein
MTNPRGLSLVGVTVCLAGCGFWTGYHVTSEGSSRRQLIGWSPPPADWFSPRFDDSSWPVSTEAIENLVPDERGPPSVYVRQRFDLGPNPEAVRQLTLQYRPEGSYVAYINGQPMGEASLGTYTLSVPPGMARASGNVLALAIHPSGTAVSMNAQLDGSAAAPQPSAIVKGPYLVNPTPVGITLLWETATAVSSLAVVDGQRYDGGGDRWHTVTVTGLESDRAYPYHVEAGATHSEEGQLTTAPPAGKRLRFVVFGDTRTGGDTHRKLVDALVAESPDFVVNTGDLVGQSVASEWETFFKLEYPLLLKTPLYPAMGNHEHDYGEEEDFARYFPLGNGKQFSGRVYSFDYGSVHLAVLDSNGELEDQESWLDRDLTAADTRGLVSFVVMHWGPACGCDGFKHGANDEANGVLKIAARHKIAGLFSGHNHLYERGVVRGVPYVVTGGGGAPLGETGRTASTQVTFAQNHYVVLDVLGRDVQLTAKSAQGAILDAAGLAPAR